MSTATFVTNQSHTQSIEWTNERSASLIFVVIAVTLLTIAYTMPIAEHWMISTQESFINSENLTSSVNDGVESRQVAMASLGLFGLAALVLPNGKTMRSATGLSALCAAYIMWCVGSCIWSDDFVLTLRRLVAFACELVAGLAIAKRCSPRQFAQIAFACTLGWLCVGLVAETQLGTFRPGEQDYRFAGLFHPNDMGNGLAILIISSLYLAYTSDRRKILMYAIAGVAIAFLVLTRSRTSLATLPMTLMVWWLVKSSASRRLAFVFVLGLAGIGIAVAAESGALDVSSDVVSMGRGDHDLWSLTGRIPLWSELISKYAFENLLFGHGYGSFWTVDRAAEVAASQQWLVSSTHSTYIDLLLNVGLVGTVLCMSLLVVAFSKASSREKQRSGSGYAFIAMVIVFTLADGLLETNLVSTNFLSFFNTCGVCFLLFHVERRSAAIDTAPQPATASSKFLRLAASTGHA